MQNEENVIAVRKMTFVYKSGRGVFDLDFSLAQGDVLGYLGPNGAGKTTTIRALLGFVRPQKGSCQIMGQDCFDQAALVHRQLGYVPGEVNLPDLTGREFLDLLEDLHRVRLAKRRSFLLDLFELDPRGPIRHFSKGMKQKLALTAAFLSDPACLILDEPTSGLDPLMSQRFVELLLEEKARGKTILLSSHSFTEVERTCARVIMIKAGRLIAKTNVSALQARQRKTYLIRTRDSLAGQKALLEAGFTAQLLNDGRLALSVEGRQQDQLLKQLAEQEILDLDIRQETLADTFFEFYQED